MTKEQIEKIKVDGVKEALIETANIRLWDVKVAAETLRANSEKFKEKITKAREALDDAEQLLTEAMK